MMSERLRTAVSRLDEEITAAFSNASPAALARLEAAQKAGITHEDRPVCPFLRPHFVARSQYEAAARAARVLSGAFERLAAAALEDASLMAELDLTEREERMARIEPRYARLCVSSRLDAFGGGADLQFLEYNAESPAGIADQMQIEKIFALVEPVARFLAREPHWMPRPHVRLLAALVAAYRETGGRREKPSIAIVDWRDVATRSEFEVLREYFEAAGHRTAIVDPRELEYDGRNLRAGAFEIDIFYKRVVIHEYLERFDDRHALVRACRDGRVCMANSFRSKIAHKKAGFAVLTDERRADLFSDEQQAAIRRHLPWTRRVRDGQTTFAGRRIELLEFLRENREGFLLKPNDDYGGKGITLGWETSESEWETAIERALAGSYVAQARAEAERVSIPMLAAGRVETRELLVDFDPFLFDGEMEGGLVRLSAQSLVNVSQGGGETALTVLEEY